MLYDITISGLGLAGLSALKELSKSSLKIAVIEKQETVAKRIECAEGIGLHLLPLLPFRLPKEAIEWKTDGMVLSNEYQRIIRKGLLWSAFTLNRRKLQNAIYDTAKNAAQNIFFGTEVESMDSRNEKITLSLSNNKRIETRYLIAADGADSKILKLMYPDRKPLKADVKSFEMAKLKLEDTKMEQLFFHDITPLGYGYIFPKSKSTANVGIAGIDSKKSIEKTFFEFMELKEVKMQTENAEIVEEKSGFAPVTGYENLNTENVLFIGDAGNHNLKPFLEGIIPGMIVGTHAGKAVMECIKSNESLAKKFEGKLAFTIADLLKDSEHITGTLLRLFANTNENRSTLNLGFFSNLLNEKEVQMLIDKDINIIMKKMTKNKTRAEILEFLYWLKIVTRQLNKFFV